MQKNYKVFISIIIGIALIGIALGATYLADDDSSIIWYAILGLIAAIVLWRESKRILRWLGFSTID